MIFNLRGLELDPEPDTPEAHRFSGRSLTKAVGATRTGMSVYEVSPRSKHWPYHFELIEEEWLFVIEGEIVLRTPEGERVMRAGDVVCFPAGAAGAHAVRNDSDAVARFAMPSAGCKYGDGCVYPDSGKFVIRTQGFSHRGRLGDTVEYWDGET
ncbi:MAG TPA: cupin domain-containing protein [Gaiellaceae bacterium]